MAYLPDYIVNAINDGYRFECSCGELYNNVAAAKVCRKCRKYTYQGYCTFVTDVVTKEVVWGRVPTAEEEAAAQELYMEEQAAADELAEEIREEYWAQLDAEDEARRLADEQRRRDEEEDQLWDIQDELSLS